MVGSVNEAPPGFTYCSGKGGRQGSKACRFPRQDPSHSPWETSRRARWPVGTLFRHQRTEMKALKMT